MHHKKNPNLKNALKNQKILALSDTGYPYKHIKDFCKQMVDSTVDVYVSPASTSRFLKIFISITGNKKVKIIKDKNLNLFNKIKPEDYIIVIFFGSKKTRETKFLTLLAFQLIVTNYNVITINDDGVDYDEDNPIFQ